MTRRVDPDFQFADLNKRRFNWLKWLTIAAIAIALALATGAFLLYATSAPR
jgi:cell division protein FtsX